MANKISQAHREMGITTPLGADVLLLESMSGTETLGRLSEYRVDLRSESGSVKPFDLLGKSVTVRVDVDRSRKRFFNGFVTAFGPGDKDAGLYVYRAVVHPWLWFLTQRTNCRIFQEKSALDVIKAVFDAPEYKGLADYDASALRAGDYAKRVYCTQYRETDFDFVSRLMEQEGIYYFFKHEDGRHTLVLADSYSAHDLIPGYDKMPYRPGPAGDRHIDSITAWTFDRTVQSGVYELNDFDFEKPRANLRVDTAITRAHDQSKHKRSDYPGGYTVTAQGTAYARVRLEALHTADQCVSAHSRARRLGTGGLFKLAEHPNGEFNREYLITGARYALQSGGYESSGGGSAEFECNFMAAPSQRPYRSPQQTPRPLVHGPHTAIVVGKSGEEIWTDKYGRVKVQFHWDGEGKKDENSSCWLRVMQPWAGKKWGAIFLPRIGHEVVVSFLEGDPDRPLIVGSVYNDDNMPPNALPDQQNKSTIKSNTTKGGSGFNEITLDDSKDAEEFFLHAQKDFKRVVRNNDTLEVGLEKKDPGDQKITIHHDQVIEIGNDGTLTIKKNRTADVKESDKLTVGKDRKVKTGTDLAVEVGADYNVKVTGKAVIEANSSIELKVGASSIKIEPAKITLSAPQLSFEATGTGEMKANGPLTLQGAIVKIN